jgi:hypothetical protein
LSLQKKAALRARSTCTHRCHRSQQGGIPSRTRSASGTSFLVVQIQCQAKKLCRAPRYALSYEKSQPRPRRQQLTSYCIICSRIIVHGFIIDVTFIQLNLLVTILLSQSLFDVLQMLRSPGTASAPCRHCSLCSRCNGPRGMCLCLRRRGRRGLGSLCGHGDADRVARLICHASLDLHQGAASRRSARQSLPGTLGGIQVSLL